MLLMASMKRRLSGEVSTSVRFADVAKTRLQTQVSTAECFEISQSVRGLENSVMLLILFCLTF